MVLDNDTRGWIMSCVSGLACIVGSGIIYVDLVVQRIPGKRTFRIQDSNTFLSSSLSLSFGVMLFSSLYGMLPSARNYLIKGGLSPQAAAYAVIGCFLGGVVGIQALSRLMHHYIPSHVVDCQHSHDDPHPDRADAGYAHHDEHASQSNGHTDEQSPLLYKSTKYLQPRLPRRSTSTTGNQKSSAASRPSRPSFQTRVSKLASGARVLCDSGGQCYGYTDPCAQECLKAKSRNPIKESTHSLPTAPSKPTLLRTTTAPESHLEEVTRENLYEDETCTSEISSPTRVSDQFTSHDPKTYDPSNHEPFIEPLDLESNRKRTGSSASSVPADNHKKQHHHHVHTNAFLSIGLQTSIAIALHKLPEGFITFATNHANPKLGFAVFMALFIHNISEGFAMALPLYLAIGSRWKSMFWSSVLGGASQPFGAGVAALWFKVAGTSDRAPGETAYGCMFAITAGIMASVALQLFSESLSLNHDRNLCFVFAFIGMGVLGISFALTA
ncbi:Zinc transporter [Xanthoria calcicola]